MQGRAPACGWLAMAVNDEADTPDKRDALELFASKLTPAGRL